MNEIGVGLLGFGTVGAGVVEGLQRNGDLLAARTGVRPVLRKIADLDIETDRGVTVAPGLLTRDPLSVVNDPGIQIVIELIGKSDAALDCIRQALAQGKPVVTANKALLAEHGAEIFRLAEENGTMIGFGASVGGGIPIIRAIRQGLPANRIESLHGILNGTCNYILTRMEDEQLSFEDALAEAQTKGYAEADPGLDIDGFDTAHKAVILAGLACGHTVPMSSVCVEGIRHISETDIRYAGDLGYRIKLLAIVKRSDGETEVRVHPALVPLDHMLASVNGVFNAVMVRGDLVGDMLYYGRGAGRNPTASTVIADVADAAKHLAAGNPRTEPVLVHAGEPTRIKPISDTSARHYLRLSLRDKPGVFARIADVLGKGNISIASVLQKDVCAGGYVPVVIVTHEAREAPFEEALREIDAMDIVGDKTVRLRIEG